MPLKGDPVTGTLQFLRMGRCVAIKGLGGFHLACNARSAEAVARLRMLKHRPSRPLAVMALNLASVEAFCHVSPEEAALLQSLKRPIVLLQKRAEADQYLPGIAPGMNTVGVMLPYTPIHWLMFHESLRRPAGLDWMEAPCADVWVMTSANLSGEPIVTDNDDARHRLNTVADAFLIHNRQVAARCDDSLMMMIDHEPHLLRRARGFAPAPLALRHDGATVLAVGYGIGLDLFGSLALALPGIQQHFAQGTPGRGFTGIQRGDGFGVLIGRQLESVFQCAAALLLQLVDLLPEFGAFGTGFARAGQGDVKGFQRRSQVLMALRVAVVKNDIAQRLAGLQSLRVHFVDGVQGFQVVVKKAAGAVLAGLEGQGSVAQANQGEQQRTGHHAHDAKTKAHVKVREVNAGHRVFA